MAYRIVLPVGICGVTTGCLCPAVPSKTGAKLGGKKAPGQTDGPFRDGARASFSGDVAAAELYEGPSCVLSVVDHRQSKRMLYAVLDHDPPQDAITTFLPRLKTAVTERDLVLQGLTTDGSPLYPAPIGSVFGAVAPQIGMFHVLTELTQGILRAVAVERKRLAQSKPTRKRGRPSSKAKTARRLARNSKTLQDKISGVCQGRCLFVKRRLKSSERKQLARITQGFPH